MTHCTKLTDAQDRPTCSPEDTDQSLGSVEDVIYRQSKAQEKLEDTKHAYKIFVRSLNT